MGWHADRVACYSTGVTTTGLPEDGPWWRSTALPVAALFAFALVLRLLFQAATPDGGTCWHIGFQGDAATWQDLAARLALGLDDIELRLPWRPPGMTYGIAFLWDGEGATVAPVRFAFTAMGAAMAPLLWLLLRRHVAAPVAWFTAGVCAASSNLMLLSSGLHNDTPYLFFVLISLLDQDRLARRPSAAVAARWGVLHGLLCLLRAEHLLAFVAFAGVAFLRGLSWRRLALAGFGAAMVLVPWQVHVDRQVTAFNAGTPQLPPVDLPWDPEAMTALRAWPSFQQGVMFRFVSDTMRVRGHERVRVEDLGVVREAFGVDPVPLRATFVALQGPMSFWYAQTPEGTDGFTQAALDRPPPLTGGAHRYPAWLRAELPRGGALSLQYPPHLDVFVNGYSRGLAELAADPVGAARRLVTKVWHLLAGATGGLGGYALPIGLSGVRRPVDIVVATGWWSGAWRTLVVAVAMGGLWRLRRCRGLWPLFAFSIVRLVVAAAYYGHARFGAYCLPIVALGVAIVVHAALARCSRPAIGRAIAVGAAIVLLGVEIVRTNSATVSIDQRRWLGSAGGQVDHLVHELEFR